MQNSKVGLESSLPYCRRADGPNPQVPPGIHVFASTSAPPMQQPTRWAWMPVASESHGAGMFTAAGVMPQGNFTPNWAYLPGNAPIDAGDIHGSETVGGDKGNQSMTSSVKENSLKKRVQRANKRAAEEDARRRENAGLRPYVV